MIIKNSEFLIVESRNAEEALLETKRDNEGKTLYIEGVFGQAEVPNGNGRIYPKAILEKAAEDYLESQVKTHQALGELNHPVDRIGVDPAMASHIIEDMWWDGNNLMGRARILETERGKTVRALIEGGWVPGVSTRGTGRLKKNRKGLNEVQPGYVMRVGVDIVHNQSAPDARVQGIYECIGDTVIIGPRDTTAEIANVMEFLRTLKLK